MKNGRVIRAAGGFFTVLTDEGESYQCRARGNLKRDNRSLMVGDRVLFVPSRSESDPGQDEGIIEQLLPRLNQLNRPSVANIDQMVVVMSIKQPSYDWQLASRLLVSAEKENIQSLLCLNKVDLAETIEMSEITIQLNPFPYKYFFSSALTGAGLTDLKNYLQNKHSVFAGPSGSGKSSLLNALQPGLSLQTGRVSEKIKRGRHTTRQAELLPLEQGGAVVDTPGFTRLDFSNIQQAELPGLFPEFNYYEGQCSFRNCLHLSEPDCAIQEHLGETINPMRYEHYRYFMEEIKSRQEVY